MAITRYEHRKNCEATEANAIGTEWVRAGLMPSAGAARVRVLLKKYLDERVLFYNTRLASPVPPASTTRLQTDLWSAVQDLSSAQPTPISALIASGMNDVLNAQAYTQGLVESHPKRGLDSDGVDRSLLRVLAGVQRT
jgi:hypothetical protein